MWNVARSIVHRQSFEAGPCQPGPRSNRCVPGVDGRLYAGFGVLPSLMVTPLLAARRENRRIDEAGSVVAFGDVRVVRQRACRRADSSRHGALADESGLLVEVVGGDGHPRLLWDGPLASQRQRLLLRAVLCAGADWRGIPSEGDSRRCGSAPGRLFLFGCSLACRVFGAIFAPLFAFYCFAVPEFGSWTVRFRRTVLFAAGAAGPAAAVAWVNYARFGSPFKTGYHLAYPTAAFLLSNGLASGIREVLFDGEVGLVWFTPWILVLPFAWKQFRKSRPLECALSVEMLLEGVLFFPRMSPGTAAGHTGRG